MLHCLNKLFYYLILLIVKKYIPCFGFYNPLLSISKFVWFLTLVKTSVSFSNNILTPFFFFFPLVFNLYTLNVVKEDVVILHIGKFT